MALGPEGLQGPAGGKRTQVARQQRSLAHRVDAVLDQLASDVAGNVASSEDEGMRQRPQAAVDRDEPVCVETEARRPEPGLRRRSGRQDRRVAADLGAIVANDAAVPERRDATTQAQHDAIGFQDLCHAPPHPAPMAEQKGFAVGDQAGVKPVRVPPPFGDPPCQAVAQAQTELHAACAAADHHEMPRALSGGDGVLELSPAFEKTVDRSHRQTDFRA